MGADSENNLKVFKEYIESLDGTTILDEPSRLLWVPIPRETRFKLLVPELKTLGIYETPAHALYTPGRTVNYTEEVKIFTEAMDQLYMEGQVAKIIGGPNAPVAARHMVSFIPGQVLYPERLTPFMATLHVPSIQLSHYAVTMRKVVDQVNAMRGKDQPVMPAFPY